MVLMIYRNKGLCGLQLLDDDGDDGNYDDGDDVDDGEDVDNGAKSVWWLTVCRRTKRATVFYIGRLQVPTILFVRAACIVVLVW